MNESNIIFESLSILAALTVTIKFIHEAVRQDSEGVDTSFLKDLR